MDDAPVTTDPAGGRGPDGAPARPEIHLTMPARAGNVAVARHMVGALAEAYKLPSSLVEDIRLAITEAFTNCVRHAYLEDEGPVDIDVAPDGDRIVIVVADTGRGMRPNPDGDGPGLGLPLISALTDAFEIVQPTSGGSALHMSFPLRPGRFQRTG